MPVTQIVDAALQLKNLLATTWVAANTRSVTPVFSTGWFAEAKKTKAQVTVTNPEDGVRFRALTTSGAAQFREGSVMVGLWVPEGITVQGAVVDSGGAKKLADLMRTETDRIVTENQNMMADFEHIEVQGARLIVEADRKPVVYRWALDVGFSWFKSP